MSIQEQGRYKVKVTGVLEKFDGEGPDKVLREKVFVEDGAVTKTEIYDENGKFIKTVEGGTHATN